MDASRRSLFLQMAAVLAGVAIPGCAAQTAARPSPPAQGPKPLKLQPLESLVPAAGLEWIILAELQPIVRDPSLQPGLGRIFPEFRMEALRRMSGIDLRTATRAIVASYSHSTLYVLAGIKDPMEVERQMRTRLMSNVVRHMHREDAILVTGQLGGGQRRAVAAFAPDVVAIESGGETHAQAAYFYSLGKLTRSPSLSKVDALSSMLKRLGSAPLIACALGPFDGEWTKGFHGLLGSATAAGAAIRITPVGTLQGSFSLLGPWGAHAEVASTRLARSWQDIAESGFGRLTGLSDPVRPPLPTHAEDAVSLTVEVNTQHFLDGLHAAVSAQISEIMR